MDANDAEDLKMLVSELSLEQKEELLLFIKEMINGRPPDRQ